MSFRVLIAAATVGAITALDPVRAADLAGDPYAAAPYEDQRYSDIYRHPAPPRYVEPYREPYPAYRRDDSYLRPMAPPPYAGREYSRYESRPYDRRDDRAYGNGCLPRQEVRDRLERQGWSDFQDISPRGDVIHVRARGRNGGWYDVTVDRCSGQVLAASGFDRRAADAREEYDRNSYRRY